jgi:hypothetical protein
MVTNATSHPEFFSEDVHRVLRRITFQDTTASMFTFTLMVGIV